MTASNLMSIICEPSASLLLLSKSLSHYFFVMHLPLPNSVEEHLLSVYTICLGTVLLSTGDTKNMVKNIIPVLEEETAYKIFAVWIESNLRGKALEGRDKKEDGKGCLQNVWFEFESWRKPEVRGEEHKSFAGMGTTTENWLGRLSVVYVKQLDSVAKSWSKWK